MNGQNEVSISDPCEKRYMLDTNIFSHMTEENIKLLEDSLLHGFTYYSSSIQEMEAAGFGAKRRGEGSKFNTCEISNSEESMSRLITVYKRLNIESVSTIATLLDRQTKVDGTQRFTPRDKNEGIELLEEIQRKKKNTSKYPYFHYHDAILAEATVHHNCYLVTDDKSFMKSFNYKLPGRAMDLNGLLNVVKNAV